ncbi:hypothetical protein C8F01DRAFT_1368427 [Mycena amicta]|nr:hypothetical protein C8F01DRAFT_1368427 [Mycena amicta]
MTTHWKTLRLFTKGLACFRPLPLASAAYHVLEKSEVAKGRVVEKTTSTEGPLSRLPPELIEVLISFVAPDMHMLAVCSLVCSGWLSPSRKRLFQRISVSLRNADRFGRLFEFGARRTRKKPSTCTFSAHVRAIELDDKLAADLWTRDVLPNLLPLLPRLTTLALFGMLPRSSGSLPPALAQCITHLELNDVHISVSRPHRLAALIASFSRLESLKVTQEVWVWDSDFQFSANKYRASRELRSVDVDDPAILQWIVEGATLEGEASKLQHVRVEVSSAETLGALRSLDKLPNLQSLDLVLLDVDVAESFLASGSSYLPTSTPLHSLRIQADHTLAGPVLLHALRHLPTSLLSTLSLDFAIPFAHLNDSHWQATVTALPWDALDAALSRLPALRPSRLTVVKVLVSPHGWRSRISQRAVLFDAKERLPRSFGRGTTGLGDKRTFVEEAEYYAQNVWQQRPAGSPRMSGCEDAELYISDALLNQRFQV